VKAYVEGHKTGANDAFASANATFQIRRKYSKPKSIEQQTLMYLEANRQFLSKTIVSGVAHAKYHITNTVLLKA
jgi:transposase